jgi:hypothetical protein
MDAVEEYTTGRLRYGCSITCYSVLPPLPPPKVPPPPMTPPGDIFFVYELKEQIDKNTAYFLWSFFSDTEGIFLPEKEPYTTILCTRVLNIPEVHKKMVEFSKLYDLRCFDSIYILPGYIAQAHID